MTVAPTYCPCCGEKWKKVGTSKQGFSVGKAVAGGLLFGPLGVVGGALGKTKVDFYCPKCGFRNSYDTCFE